MKKVFVVLGVAVIVLALAGLYGYSLTRIEVVDVRITGVSEISLEGFTISWQATACNPNPTPIYLKKIEFDVIFNNKSWYHGKIADFKVDAKSERVYVFEEPIEWNISIMMMRNIIESGNANVRVEGVVTVAEFGFVNIQIPFSDDMDIKKELTEFVTQKTEEIIGTGIDVGKTAGGILRAGMGLLT